ncbi:aminodeoxychorismate lyase [Alkalihalobacillus sp. MEB130]|uniref:aminodeoxychorismate lyase n=1 Tax=Alkalihalobacillus sp. MEB130 TaxID=2976704 RepID=UPI0028E06B71|nr:aminodeoxychorismate lyase [Alkalihalobacillus sp. MEB130]MDT8862672.1 aminodeoxychorismate lyase [Alkalihalobacillus sp. MEB130]
MFIYVNGQIVSREQATISAFDHGYMYGLGLFETFRVDDGHPFLLDDHFQRLQDGLQTLGISWKMERAEILEVINQLLEANHLTSAYVRWNVSAGPHDLGLYTGEYIDPTIIVYIKPLPSVLANAKQAKLLTTKRNTPEGKSRLKSHHYLNNVLAKREIGDDSKVEGIFLTEDGFVAEGVVSNLFWVKDGVVYTPSIETGILNGITRQFILRFLKEKNIPFEIGFYRSIDVKHADEAFITNSIQEVVPLHSFDGFEYTKERVFTKELQKLFHRYRKQLWSRAEL